MKEEKDNAYSGVIKIWVHTAALCCVTIDMLIILLVSVLSVKGL